MSKCASYWVRESHPVVTRRPWWNILGRDSLSMEHCWVRKHTTLSDENAEKFINNFNIVCTVFEISPLFHFIQVEDIQTTTEFVKSGE